MSIVSAYFPPRRSRIHDLARAIARMRAWFSRRGGESRPPGTDANRAGRTASGEVVGACAARAGLVGDVVGDGLGLAGALRSASCSAH